MELKGKKVLVTGGNGLLGSRIISLYAGKCHLCATYNQNHFIDEEIAKCSVLQLDVRNLGAVKKAIKDINPDIVIHAAALTNLDFCEKNKEQAWAVNVEGTMNVAEACKITGAKLVYVSTDYVFDGSRGMYKEDDEVRPVNYYALTKLEGEKIVSEVEGAIIGRTSVLYGVHTRANFVVWAIKELGQGHKINILTDQFNSPTFADDLAETLLLLAKKGEQGIFHTAGRQRINRFEFTRKIADIFGLDSNLINPITSDKITWVAKRPMDSSLDVSKVSRIKKPLDVSEGLLRMKDSQ